MTPKYVPTSGFVFKDVVKEYVINRRNVKPI